jgi:competence protein ComEC
MLKVHFLNVGHGDCTIVEHHSGRLTMIDVNNSQDYDADTFGEVLAEVREKERAQQLAGALSLLGGNAYTGLANPFAPSPLTNPFAPLSLGVLTEVSRAIETVKKEVTDPVAFMQRHYPGRRLWRFILTHPDLDHMRGIKRLHETIGFDNFWDTSNMKPTPNFNSDADKDDWNYYQQLRRADSGFRHAYMRHDQYYAFNVNADGTAGGDGIEILSPTPATVSAANSDGRFNNLSFVLRFWHAGASLLLPGDIEAPTWEELQKTYGVALKSAFMRASHHGRDSGYHLPTLQLIKPRAMVVSVGRKPSTDAHNKYCAQCGSVYSTRYYGNLELRIYDDGTYRWFCERNGK